MKCPKCGYLGFEDVERCRNCGYDFSFTSPPDFPELSLKSDDPPPRYTDAVPDHPKLHDHSRMLTPTTARFCPLCGSTPRGFCRMSDSAWFALSICSATLFMVASGSALLTRNAAEAAPPSSGTCSSPPGRWVTWRWSF